MSKGRLLRLAAALYLVVLTLAALPPASADMPATQSDLAPPSSPINALDNTSNSNLYVQTTGSLPDVFKQMPEEMRVNHGMYDNPLTALYEQWLLGEPIERQAENSNSLSDSYSDAYSYSPLKAFASLYGPDSRMSGGTLNGQQNEFQIDINPNDSRYAVAGANYGAGFISIGLYRTSDGGLTWATSTFPGPAVADPTIAYSYDGTVYAGALTNLSNRTTAVIRSTDNGATWSDRVIVAAFDRESLVVDNAPGSPRRGTVYLTYFSTSNRIQLYKSSDQGQTWSGPAFVSGPRPVNGYHQAAMPVVAADGTLYVGYQEYENSTIGCAAPVRNWVAQSTDGGKTFTQHLITGAAILQGGTCSSGGFGRGWFCINGSGSTFHSRSHPILGKHPTDANVLYVVYSGGDLEAPYTCGSYSGYHSDTIFVKSTDRGMTWGPKIKINTDPPGWDQYFPWMDVAPNGTIWVGWNDRREDPNNFRSRWYQAYSTDEGATWNESPVADVQTQPSTFIGDYHGLAAENDRVLGVWYDSRDNSTGDPYTDPDAPIIGGTPTSTPMPTHTPPAATATATATITPTPLPPSNTPVPPSATSTSQPTATATKTATSIPTCSPSWANVYPPNANEHTNFFMSVSATAADDVWAVGRYTRNTDFRLTLIEHWDGTQWRIIPSPNMGLTGTLTTNVLYGVAALTPDNAWAVGEYNFSAPGGGGAGSLIQHWDGTEWSIVTTPYTATLNGIAAVSADDIWAVGSFFSMSHRKTFTLHWDGIQWSHVPSPSPNPQNRNELRAVAAVAPNDVWAVGDYESGNGATLIMHWNGSEWSVVPSPNPSGGAGILYGIEAVSANDIWAVGGGLYDTGGGTLTLHWDGIQWSIVPSPRVEPGSSWFRGVTAIAADDVWAVGAFTDFAGTNGTLIAHWDGSRWSRVESQDPTNMSRLLAVTKAPPNDLWAVGDYYPGPFVPTLLAKHYSRIFTDVPPEHPFYANIRCLVCRDIISGYADNTFRPGNDITRGQIAKMVSGAAGINDPVPPTQQTYTDVAPDSTFWLWIERLSMRGVMSGYQCGVPPAGPCDPQSRPYFLWGNNATRGQISKIVSEAAGITDPIPPTQQTFSDVPSSNTFWLYIERLTDRGVMSGYPCGSPPAGPCDPQNRPWFLPFNNVTRGQSSKIVANTFFPNCVTP